MISWFSFSPGWWESNPHTPIEGVLFLKGNFLSPSCQRGLSCVLCQLRERESREIIPREISLPNPPVLEVGVVSTLYIEGNRPREQKY